MNDAMRLDIGDWLAAFITILIAIGGGIAAWLRGRAHRMDTRFEELDDHMADLEKALAKHDEMLAVLAETQRHTKDLLKDINDQLRTAFQLVPKGGIRRP